MAATLSWPSIRTLCGIFCCPPLPSKIAAKLAFVPPIATYALHTVEENGGTFTSVSNTGRTNSVATETIHSEGASANSEDELVMPSTSKDSASSGSVVKESGARGEWVGKGMRLELLDTADWQFTHKELVLMDACTSVTSRGETIACLFIKTQEHSEYTILFSHGNAVDIGQMSSFLLYLSVQLKCNILTYDYSGYGMSTGRPTELNLYADIDAAWRCLTGRYNVPAERVILYGQSIGTVPTIDLAARQSVAGVVLHSPLLSGMRMAFPETKQTWFFDAFPSIDKVGSIQSVVLVIHGTEDEVINISHGHTIHESCPRAVEPLWVRGAGHNDIEHYEEYLQRLTTFINVELATS